MNAYRFDFKAMGSPCEIRLYAGGRRRAERVADAVKSEVGRLEARYSRYRSDSDLSAINRVAAAGGEIEVDSETAGLLDYAATCWRESGGLFDISSGVLRRLWRFDSGALPNAADLKDLLGRVGWHRVRWESPLLAFPEPGMEIDFGGVVKEYAADRAAALSLDLGLSCGMINLGGDIRVIGPHPDGSPWRIGIRDPRCPGETIATIGLCGGGLASSGDYERRILFEGVRYGHILNPRTGWPVRRLAAVSAVGDLCVVAGSASTIGMLKEDQGPVWLAELGLPHLWVDVNGEVGGPLAA
jgi:FAD:protein FMN transferase